MGLPRPDLVVLAGYAGGAAPSTLMRKARAEHRHAGRHPRARRRVTCTKCREVAQQAAEYFGWTRRFRASEGREVIRSVEDIHEEVVCDVVKSCLKEV